MENSGRLYAQVAAEAGVQPEKAMVACYLQNLSRQGKTLAAAAALLRTDRADARDCARDWGIAFVDYTPTDAPTQLAWRKVKRGQWAMHHASEIVALATSDGRGGYRAHATIGDRRDPFDGSKAEVAMRQLSLAMERHSLDLFGVDDVAIFLVTDDGRGTRLAPKIAEDPGKLRRALIAA